MSCNSGDSSSCSPAPNSTAIDSLLVDLFSFMQETCKNCREKTPAAARCVECNLYLCNPCINIHNKNHEVIKLQDNASSSISIDSVSDSSEATTSPFNMRRMICDIHQEPARVFCITCYVSACSDCVINIHSTHELSYMNEENMMAVHMKLQDEARSSMAVVVRATDNVRMMSTKLHTKLQMRVADMKQTFQRYIAALEARSHELVAQMEYIHRVKVSRLVSQMERLQVVEARLRYVSNQLNAAYVSTSNSEFIMANERAHNELKSIRSFRTELTPCEDDNIQFVQSDRGFYSALRALGHVTGGPSTPPVAPRLPIESPPTELAPSVSNAVLKCRPIYGASGEVVVKHPSDSAMVFSNDGVEDGELCRPWGVCCSHQGHIIVSDRSNNRIQVFDPNGKFLYKFGSQGSGMGEFERPTGVCVSPNNNIVVADKDNHRIQIFRMDGTFMFAFGEKGTNNGQFNYPWDVACNSSGAIAVSDTRNHRIQLFTSTGSFINKYGYESNNAMWKYFDSPRGVAFTPDGSLLVSDFNKHRIIIIDKSFVNARFLGGEGSRDKQFLRPQGIVCDDRGNIVVADSKNHRIQVFDSRGNFLFRVGRYGKNGVGDFDRPSGICLSPNGRIIVVDFGNARMQVL